MKARLPEHTRLWRDVWVVVYEAPDGIWPDDPYHPVSVPPPTQEHLRFAWACNSCDTLVSPPERPVIYNGREVARVPSLALPPSSCPSCGSSSDRVWEKPLYIDASYVPPSRASLVRAALVHVGVAASEIVRALTM